MRLRGRLARAPPPARAGQQDEDGDGGGEEATVLGGCAGRLEGADGAGRKVGEPPRAPSRYGFAFVRVRVLRL